MSSAIPPGAWAASICVLIYSALCFSSTALLSTLLIANGERFTCKTISVHRG